MNFFEKGHTHLKLDDIQGFIYGAQSSRFWMLRKHLNADSAPSHEAHAHTKNLPFYSWECLTLRLKNKEIDLVIEDDKILMILIEFLIYELKTVDGMRDSGNFYLHRTYEAQTFSKRNRNILKTLTEHDIQLIKHYN